MRKIAISNQSKLLEHFCDGRVCNTELAFKELNQMGEAGTKRTAERRLCELGLWPTELNHSMLEDEFNRPLNALVLEKQLELARSKRSLILFIQLHIAPNGTKFLHANSAKGGRYWVALKDIDIKKSVYQAIEKFQNFFNKSITLFPHNELVSFFRDDLDFQNYILF